jgi:hypothetical protein
MIFSRICPICGIPFETSIKTKIYCTIKCREKNEKRKYEKKFKEEHGYSRYSKYSNKFGEYTVLKKAICSQCGIQFFTSSNGSRTRKYCYKCHPKPGRVVGSKHSDMAKEKMRQSHIGKHHDLITKWKISKSHMGKNVGPKHPNWRGGKKNNKYCHKFNAEFKERVRAYFNFRCILCGKQENENISKKTGKVLKLSVHHVNYNKSACCNDDIPKLFAPLCLSCHTKTNYNREKWERKISKMLHKRYNGKCFLHKMETLKAYC